MAALAAYNCQRKLASWLKDQLTGVIAAVATAVDETGAPDAARSDQARTLPARHRMRRLNVLGTTGEATSLSVRAAQGGDERLQEPPACRSTG
jgi:hypothetical protein